ncbi:MAG: hypothetical protein D3916_01375, partial [Candidatus Electrothrix sp. MAN1_4]|nr:hypothetical protein [Candidatus Electrothrix sp. MAN1_4]
MKAQRINRLGGQKGTRAFGLFDFMDMMIKRICWITGALILSLLPVTAAQGAGSPADDDLRIEIISAYNLVVDSNVTSPSTYAPSAATLGAKICNTSNRDLTDVQIYIGDYTNGTPGTYPARDSDKDAEFDTAPLDWLKGTGQYSLTHESGSFASTADASRTWIGTLKANSCRTEYWVVSYPQCVNVNSGSGFEADYPPCVKSITGGIKPEDDLWLKYDIWATAFDDDANNDETPDVGQSLEAYDTRKLTMRSEISAS